MYEPLGSWNDVLPDLGKKLRAKGTERLFIHVSEDKVISLTPYDVKALIIALNKPFLRRGS